ncbi:putative tgf beta receptor associated protein 1 [Diplodia seriata]|uniref:Putative tgf beta receptor associated protein 1 n=1 Tax=Diplodia seriata TaxID=420778 RepID=A0A0G2FVE6_9PEZI|nr:putative tgf beta receptor associated protein 1 [Diplodia seriata]
MQATASPTSPRSGNHIQTGSYTLRKLLSDIPLSADGNDQDVRITCVEFWNENLYIGTSAAEILHFVLIPPEPNDPLGQPSFIIASRLQPAFTQQSTAGVQQILLLPNVNKACILCNNALTFYTLPELSPAFASQKPISCVWVGGVDQNGSPQNDSEQGAVIMMCLRSRIQLVRIAEEPRRIRNIEFGGCLSTSRRDDFACVADTHSYALLDVVHQQKIPLFPISSLDEDAASTVGGASQDISSQVDLATSIAASMPSAEQPEEGYILAVIKRKTEHGMVSGVEIQRWDLDPGEGIASKEWLNLSMLSSSLGEDVHHTRYSSQALGIRTVSTETEVNLSEISDILSLRRVHLRARRRGGSISVSASEKIDLDKKVEADKERDEVAFTSRLCKFKSHNVLWNNNEVWWVVRNPLIVQLDAKLKLAQSATPGSRQIEPNFEDVVYLLNSIRGLEPRNEAEFLGFTYIRQKASLLLFMDLILRTESGTFAYEINKRGTEEALIEGEIDPRVILALLPNLSGEVIQGEKGIWVQGGLKDVVEKFLAQQNPSKFPTDPAGPFGDNLLQLIKRYLLVWRRKKGFGSVADEEEEFRKYLSRIRDQPMVEEYGTWLANRNPKLGVQVFADENSRVKFKHEEAVSLLKEKAPAAVKEYLEYLVYGKKVSCEPCEATR